jgi:hypothetical protein
MFTMLFLLVGEFLLCLLIVFGSILLVKAHPKVAEGMFYTYAAFILMNYFVVRWKYEYLKRKVFKFKKLRKRVTNFDFGQPNPVTPAPPAAAPPKKSK